VMRQHLEATRTTWDANRPEGTPAFSDLSRAQQTVLFSRTYHQGPNMPQTAVAQEFYGAAQQGNWIRAEQALRDYQVTPTWYRTRVGAEADLLRAERLINLPR